MTMNTSACDDFCNTGAYCKAHGNYDEAIDNYLHAFALNDTNEIGQQLARLYFITGKYEEAMKYYLRFFAVSYKDWLGSNKSDLPDFMEIYLEVGYTYLACSNRLRQLNLIDYLSRIDTFNQQSYHRQLQKIRDLGHAERLENKLRTDNYDIERIGYRFFRDVCTSMALPPLEAELQPFNTAQYQ